ncbi:hypothetical protein [Luteolibacter soli]|uniref:Uncharacterized protein n=1 Tax=Luteolibacter soli TaxID=3135280 RepID=A0ABU9AQC5_9BACT
MRFRLFRSRAFWLGVPGLVFLLWAWVDSMRYATLISGSGRVEVKVWNVWGTASFAVWRDPIATGLLEFDVDRKVIRDEETKQKAKHLAELGLAWLIADRPGFSASMRHSMVLPSYLLLWLALVAGQWWRFKRALLDSELSDAG